MATEPTFEEWLDYVGLTKQGRDKLEKATVCSIKAVQFLTVEDIVELRLGVGDRGLFRYGWEALRTPSDKGKSPEPTPEEPTPEEYSSKSDIPTSTDAEAKIYSISDIAKFLGHSPSAVSGLNPPPAVLGAVGGVQGIASQGIPNIGARLSSRASTSVTAKTLAKDQLLNRLASQFAQGGLQDTLSLQELSIAGLIKGEKALLPVNFVTIFSGCGVDEEEVVGTGQYQGRLVWQSGKGGSAKRPTADKLSYGQFFEASARILNLLNLDENSYSQYLDYLRQLGILLQTFTASTVFTLDHIHRQYIHETGNPWNFIENTLENSVLRKKDDAARGLSHGGFAGQSSRRNDRSDGRRDQGRRADSASQADNSDKVCWLYNMRKGCPWGDKCFYPHVCSVDRCRASHPAFKHVEKRSGDDKAKSSS
jgi:hypothetical protein